MARPELDQTIDRGSSYDSAETATRFLENPPAFFDYSLTKLHGIDRDDLDRLQLAGLKIRFEQLRDAIPMLSKLADGQKVSRIDKIEDILPLLFTHATYKSYPMSLLEKKRFDQLTRWLGKLTTVDLSHVDTSACQTVDDWLLTMKRETDLLVTHTSGTTGTMSFIPKTERDYRLSVRLYIVMFFQEFGREPPEEERQRVPLNIPCIYPYYRDGGSAQYIVNDFYVEMIAGSEDNFHAAYPERASADLLLLAARRRAAIARGMADSFEISPELEDRRREFDALQRDTPEHVANFLAGLREELAGRRVHMLTAAHLLHGIAEPLLKKGVRDVFSPDSVVTTGGGAKGMILPDDWKETIKQFLGVRHLNMIYGMSEITTQFQMCEHGHYHNPPTIISFILDPETGDVFPRSGRATGRFAFFDLLPDTRWGGFVTGDEVTMVWDERCACGRTTPYLENHIQRLSERKQFADGDEKITCAATAGAYEEALSYLRESER